MRPRPVIAAAAGALSLALSGAAVVPATAAPAALSAPTALTAVKATAASSSSVKINKISNKTVASSRSTAKLAPSVKVGKNVKVSSTRITVKQGSKTRAKNAGSYKAKPGSYKVTTTVKYKVKKVSTKIVAKLSDTTKKFKGTCKLIDTESRPMDAKTAAFYDLPPEIVGLETYNMSLNCTSKSFDQTIAGSMFFVLPWDEACERGWDDYWQLSPNLSNTMNGPFFMQDDDTDTVTEEAVFMGTGQLLTKTTTTWSKTKTLTKTQTVKVGVRKR